MVKGYQWHRVINSSSLSDKVIPSYLWLSAFELSGVHDLDYEHNCPDLSRAQGFQHRWS